MSIFSDLFGTTTNFFRLGITGVRLKNNAGNLAVRNSGDTADAELTASKVNNTGNDVVIGTTNTMTLSRNAATASPIKFVFPAVKGTDGQLLRQKAGTPADTIEFEYVTVGGNTNQSSVDTTTLAFGSTSPLALFTLPANAIIYSVRVTVDTPFNGSPSLSIGVAGTTAKYLASNQVDLTTASGTIFEIYPGLPSVGTTEALIATYAAGGANAGSARIEIEYAIPS